MTLDLSAGANVSKIVVKGKFLRRKLADGGGFCLFFKKALKSEWDRIDGAEIIANGIGDLGGDAKIKPFSPEILAIGGCQNIGLNMHYGVAGGV